MGEKTMKSLIKLFASVSCVTLLVVGLSPAARADAWNKKTILTINQPIQVPNKVLDPGQYVFKLADSQSDRHIVQIFNGDETHIITTILAIPNYRLQPTGRSQFTFWETPAGEPRALRAWFYPGDNFGQEFPYRPAQFARIMTTRAPAVTYTQSTQETAKVEETPKVEEKVEERTEIAQNTPPPPEPAPAPAAAEPPPAPVQAPAELPHTGSYYPLITLAGLLSLGGFVITGMRSKRTQ
jgi:LPXTG-motif cell wall-anchored protein